MTLTDSLLVPLGLGLLGFIEPCTVGSSLLFVKYLEGKTAAAKLLETTVFTATRALFIGSLGALAALAGPALLPLQRTFWFLLGSAYVVLGLFYIAGEQGFFLRAFGPTLGWARRARGAAALGVIFGLNIPACAAPLLAALFAASLGTATVARGFWTMAVFGLALSLPLVGLVCSGRTRHRLEQLALLSRRVPRWTGAVFVVLGTWSVYMAAK